MIIQRQPTIKTLLLMTAAFAAQASSFPRWTFHDTVLGLLTVAFVAILWALPLFGSLLFRSVTRCLATCVVAGIVAILLKGMVFEQLIAPPHWYFSSRYGSDLLWAGYLAVGTPVQAWTAGTQALRGNDWDLWGKIVWLTAYSLTGCALANTSRLRPSAVASSRAPLLTFKRVRGWFRYRPWKAALLLAVIAVGITWWGLRRSITARREAFEALKVSCDDVAPQSTWRRWLLGDDSARYAERIRAGGDRFTDAEMAHFKELTQLQSLSISGSEVTDAGMANLAGLTNLRELTLGNNQATGAGLANLNGMTQLRVLTIYGDQATDSGLACLKGLTQLESLQIGSDQTTDAGLSHLQGLVQLQSLVLYAPQMTDVGLVHLKALTQLTWLKLDHNEINGSGLEHLKDLAQLYELDLAHTRVTDEGLAHLKPLAELRSLDLRNTLITDAGLAHLKDLTHLRAINLCGTQVTDAGLVHLKDLAELQSLVLGQTAVADTGLVHLAGLANLAELELSNTRVTDAGMVHLIGLAQLNGLTLIGTQVTDVGLAQFKGLTNLAWLHLGAQVTNEGVAELQKSLPNCYISQQAGSQVE